MSTNSMENLKVQLNELKEKIILFILGPNQERVEWIVERYYQLKPRYRTILNWIVLVFWICLAVLGAWFFISKLFQLDQKLTNSVIATRQLSQLDKSFSISHYKFQQLKDQIELENKDLNVEELLSFIGKQAKVGQINVRPGSEITLSKNDPLSQNFKKVSYFVELPKTSVRSFVNFFIEIEKALNLFRPVEVSILQSPENKLYFSVSLQVHIILPR